MKSDSHPKYEAVVFNDLASGTKFLTRSTVSSKKTIEWEDGNTYPVIDVEISSESTRSTRASSASWTPQAASSASTLASRASAARSNSLHPKLHREARTGNGAGFSR
jgi:ribosomal protein L31